MSKMDYTDEFLKKRKERQRKARKRRLISGFIIFIIFCVLVGVALSLTVLFPIKNMIFTGSKIYTPTQIQEVSGIDLGDNLFRISYRETLNKLKSKLPYIEDIKIERTLPDNLKITVKDAKKYACYIKGEEFYTVSQSGWVLEKTSEKPQNIFTVFADNVSLKVGKAVEFKDQNIPDKINLIINSLNSQNLSIDYIDVSQSVNLKAGVEGRFDVIFGNTDSLEYKVKYLKATIDDLADSKSGSIDLSMLNEQNSQAIFRENNTK